MEKRKIDNNKAEKRKNDGMENNYFQNVIRNKDAKMKER